MKKYLKELIIAVIETAFLFLFPLIPMGNKDAHIILLLVITLIIRGVDMWTTFHNHYI